jgi:hypothetical protein
VWVVVVETAVVDDGNEELTESVWWYALIDGDSAYSVRPDYYGWSVVAVAYASVFE